jgi:hypothetical protein
VSQKGKPILVVDNEFVVNKRREGSVLHWRCRHKSRNADGKVIHCNSWITQKGSKNYCHAHEPTCSVQERLEFVKSIKEAAKTEVLVPASEIVRNRALKAQEAASGPGLPNLKRLERVVNRTRARDRAPDPKGTDFVLDHSQLVEGFLVKDSKVKVHRVILILI